MAQARTRNAKAIKELADKITSVDDVDPYVKILVYGNNGSGKTRFAASSPKCLIADVVEEGTRSVTGTGTKKVPIASWEEIGHLYWLLKGLTDKRKCPFESVAIDTVSALNNLAMSMVLGEAEERDPSREKQTPTKRDYGRQGELMKAMMLAYRNLPLHVIFTAQQRTVTDQDTGDILEYAVDLPKGARAVATGSVSVVGYMERRSGKIKGKRQVIDTMRVEPNDERVSLKDRTNQLGPVMRQPTMAAVIKAWNNTES